jgi:hypothetical protein
MSTPFQPPGTQLPDEPFFLLPVTMDRADMVAAIMRNIRVLVEREKRLGQ